MATPTYVTSTKEGVIVPSDPETTNIVLGSTLTDGYIIVSHAGFGTNPSTWAVTFDGSAMTLLISDTRSAFGSTYYVALWGLAVGNKAADTYTVSANIDAVHDEYNVFIAAYNNVHQSASVGTAVSADGSGTTPTVDVSSAVGELVVDCVTFGGGSGAVGAGQTARQTQLTTTGGGISEEAGGATVTMSWTQDSADWLIAAVPLKPTAGESETITMDKWNPRVDPRPRQRTMVVSSGFKPPSHQS